MGLSDRLKDLRKQAETAVAERKDQITGAVETAGAAANQRTKGKYADKIAKVGGRVTSAVDKISSQAGTEQAGAGGTDASAAAGDPSAGAGAPVASTDADAGAPAASTAPPEFE